MIEGYNNHQVHFLHCNGFTRNYYYYILSEGNKEETYTILNLKCFVTMLLDSYIRNSNVRDDNNVLYPVIILPLATY